MLRASQDHPYDYLPSVLITVCSEEDARAEFGRQRAEWDARTLFVSDVWEKRTGTHGGESYLTTVGWGCRGSRGGIVQARTGKGMSPIRSRAG